MTLYNAFGSLALDQSVMATTPLLKAINTTLQATPYIYVVNPTSNITFPNVQNVNLANVSTPPSIQNVFLTSTPIVSLANTQVEVQNWPTVTNVNLANVPTPPSIQNVAIVSTPIVYAQITNTAGSSSNVNVTNASLAVVPASLSTPIVVISSMPPVTANVSLPAIQNVNIANVSTPPTIQQVSFTSTPIVYSYQPFPYSVVGTVGISNFPSGFNVNNFPIVQNVNLANVSTPPTTQNVNIVNAATPLYATIFNNATPQNVTVTNITSTPVVMAYQPFPYAVTGTVGVSNFPSSQNVVVTSTPIIQLANTQVTVQNWPTTQPISGSVSVSNFPATQNVNVTNAATPLLVYQTNVLSTPIVQLANTQVAVQNFPATYPLGSGVVNVNVANPSTPPAIQNVNITSTPIVYAYQPFPNSVVGTVGVSNFPSSQNVVVTSTPVVSILNTNVGVNNWPTVFPPGSAVVNVNLANPSTPPSVQNVNIVNAATPLYVYQTNASTPVVISNILSTPIVYAYQPFPYSVLGTVSVSNLPSTQNVAITSTPIVSLANTQVTVQNWPATQPISGSVSVSNFPASQNVVLTSTPVVSILNTNVGVNNWPTSFQVSNFPATQNVNIVNASTPLYVDTLIGQSLDVSLLSTPITYAYQPYPYSVVGTVGVSNFPAIQNVAITSTPVVSILNTIVGVNNFPTTFPPGPTVLNVNLANVATPPTTQNVNIVQAATPLLVSVLSTPLFPVYANITNVTATPVVSLANTQVTVQNLPATPVVYAQVTSLPQSVPAISTGFNTSYPNTWATPITGPIGTKSLNIKSYAISTQVAATVAFAATPTIGQLGPFNIGNVPQALKNSVYLAGPFYMAANTTILLSADVLGQLFTVNPSTPLWIISSNGTGLGGHITYEAI